MAANQNSENELADEIKMQPVPALSFIIICPLRGIRELMR